MSHEFEGDKSQGSEPSLPHNKPLKWDIDSLQEKINHVFSTYSFTHSLISMGPAPLKSKKHLVFRGVMQNQEGERTEVVLKLVDKSEMGWQGAFQSEIENYDRVKHLVPAVIPIQTHVSPPISPFYSIPMRLFNDNIADADYALIIYSYIPGNTLLDIILDKNLYTHELMDNMASLLAEFFIDLHGNGYGYMDPRLTNFIAFNDSILCIIDFEEIAKLSGERCIEENISDLLSAFLDFTPGIFDIIDSKEDSADISRRDIEDLGKSAKFAPLIRGIRGLKMVIGHIFQFYKKQPLPLLLPDALRGLDDIVGFSFWIELIVEGLIRTAKRRNISLSDENINVIKQIIKSLLEAIRE